MLMPSEPSSMQTSLYVHFPFCLKKCLYCDFNSVAGTPVTPEEYSALVVREMELRRACLARASGRSHPLLWRGDPLTYGTGRGDTSYRSGIAACSVLQAMPR